MNSPDTTPQIQALEIEIQKLVARPPSPGDGTQAVLASQMMQKENLQKDLMQQVKLNQDQMIRDQMEQARLRHELAQKDQLQQARLSQEQTQRDKQTQARLRQEQIQRYEKEQARLKQEHVQREQLEQARRRQEQMQREQLQQARIRQEQIQRQQQMQARLKQEQMQREKARQEQIQKERMQQEKLRQEKLRQEQAQKELLLAARLKEERSRINQLKQDKKEITQNTKTSTATHILDKKTGKMIAKTPEQLAKDEEARAFSSRTEMSLTSIAFCSPLMLFGMGAAMSIFDNFSGKGKNPALIEARRKSQQQMELSEYACRQADKKFNEMVERNNLTNNSNLSNISDQNATKFSAAKSERLEQKPKTNRFIAAETAAVARKNDSLEVKKLWKERQRLLEHLERVRGQGSLALVSKLVSHLETLDRSLKRLGCDPQA